MRFDFFEYKKGRDRNETNSSERPNKIITKQRKYNPCKQEAGLSLPAKDEINPSSEDNDVNDADANDDDDD